MSQTCGETPRRHHGRRSRGSAAHRGTDGAPQAPARGGTGAGTGGGRQDPQAMAGKAATALIQSRAPQLKISKHDGFVAKKILTSGDLNYAPYERTWRGLPVVGGDFVVVTDDEGHVLTTSVAQTSKIELASTTPRVLKGRATTVARQQLDKVTRDRGPAPGRVAGQDLPPRLGDPGQRPRPRPPLDPVGVRRRALRQVPGQQGARRRGHRHRQLGGRRHHPDDRLRLVVLDDQQQRHHPEVPELLGQRHVHRHRRRLGQRQRDRPRDRLRRRVLLRREDAPDDVVVAGPQRHERLRRLGADPRRPQRRQRLLRRHPGADRPHARPPASGSAPWTSSRTSSATASTT